MKELHKYYSFINKQFCPEGNCNSVHTDLLFIRETMNENNIIIVVGG